MFEALNLYLEEPKDSDDLPPFPKKRVLGKDVVKVPVDPEVAFSFTVRHYRINHGITFPLYISLKLLEYMEIK